ncbi:ubiquinone biosynthesis protein COQ9 [Hesseltinella vesiculosa]|uniref:Ubiquinone biosynthesis protein n=1 Tax=Hesseltinella vesiculosa TaxID=101127 RepID=A0A1X2GK22_9FUNG|nr:ubiquinone biosynthesis protein COQ9 [Hesseltinella vesiculosa]
MLRSLSSTLRSTHANVSRTTLQRCYSTIDHTPNNDKQDVEQTLLHASLKYVPAFGWSQQSILQAAEDLGLSPAVQGVFPGGGAGLVDAYLKDCRRQFVNAAQQLDLDQDPSVTSKIRQLTRLRLKLLEPVAPRWPEALATVSANPTTVPSTLGHLVDIVDDIWYLAGDRSPDMNWYTKRASLAAVYSATELYMSQDLSQDYIETYRFLDRRLSDAACVGSTASQLGTMLSFGAKSLVGMMDQRGRR